eukprot:151517-Chlamydomonas_euryale.AAC.1
MEKLRDAIASNREKDAFLVEYRFAPPEEDFEVGIRAYEWPRKMVDIMKEATTKVNLEHKEFEAQVRTGVVGPGGVVGHGVQ